MNENILPYLGLLVGIVLPAAIAIAVLRRAAIRNQTKTTEAAPTAVKSNQQLAAEKKIQEKTEFILTHLGRGLSFSDELIEIRITSDGDANTTHVLSRCAGTVMQVFESISISAKEERFEGSRLALVPDDEGGFEFVNKNYEVVINKRPDSFRIVHFQSGDWEIHLAGLIAKIHQARYASDQQREAERLRRGTLPSEDKGEANRQARVSSGIEKSEKIALCLNEIERRVPELSAGLGAFAHEWSDRIIKESLLKSPWHAQRVGADGLREMKNRVEILMAALLGTLSNDHLWPHRRMFNDPAELSWEDGLQDAFKSFAIGVALELEKLGFEQWVCYWSDGYKLRHALHWSSSLQEAHRLYRGRIADLRRLLSGEEANETIEPPPLPSFEDQEREAKRVVKEIWDQI